MAATSPDTPIEMSGDTDRAPRGKWRTHLCDCFQFCGLPAFWCALCCPICSIGQLMTRNGIDMQCRPKAVPMKGELTPFTFLFGVGTVYVIFGAIPSNVLSLSVRWTIQSIFMIAALIYGMVLRRHIRKKFEIPGSGVEDCLCMYFCACCSIIQMNSHTHDLQKHGDCAACLTHTGLVQGAPLVTEV